MNRQNRLMEGRPELRIRFENLIVSSTEDKIESFSELDVLALRVENGRVVTPSKISEYPGILRKFVNGDGIYNNKPIHPFISNPILETLTDVIIHFYKENIQEFVNKFYKVRQSQLSNEIRTTINKKVKEGFIDNAFKLSIKEILHDNINDVIVTTFTTLAKILVFTITTTVIIGSKFAAATLGVGALIMGGVIINKAVKFKENFKNKLSLQIRDSSHRIYDELNIRLYNLLDEAGLLDD